MTLTGRARVAGVIGWPVSHSLSPRLHGFWLELHRVDGAYVPLAVKPASLPDVLRTLPRMGFVGVNLTLPHKEIALSLMDRLDPLALRTGAVNTVIVAADGTLSGSNTDVFGFIENIRQAWPDFDAGRGPVVILGAGGAARAVIAALDGCPDIRLVNRNAERAESLAQHYSDAPLRLIAWNARADALAGATLLVNTTSLGMRGQPPLEIALDALPKTALVTDVVYTPLETALLRAARQRGNRVVDGLGMLLHQARPGFAAWFGETPTVTPALRAWMEGP